MKIFKIMKKNFWIRKDVLKIVKNKDIVDNLFEKNIDTVVKKLQTAELTESLGGKTSYSQLEEILFENPKYFDNLIAGLKNIFIQVLRQKSHFEFIIRQFDNQIFCIIQLFFPYQELKDLIPILILLVLILL